MKRVLKLNTREVVETMYRDVYQVSDPILLKQLVDASHEWQVAKKCTLLHTGGIPEYLFFLA